MWDKRAYVTNVHDGDTITVTLDQGFGDLKEGMRLRLYGVFAPELSQEGGNATRDFVLAWLKEHHDSAKRFPFVVTTIRTPRSDKEVTTLERYVAIVQSGTGVVLNESIRAYLLDKDYLGGVGS